MSTDMSNTFANTYKTSAETMQALSGLSTSTPFKSAFLFRSRFTLLLAIGLTIGVIGLGYYQEQLKLAEQSVEHRIRAIGELKSQEISRWIKARKRDAATLFYNRLDNSQQRYLTRSSSVSQEEDITKWLSSLARSFDYQAVALLDAWGRPKAMFPAETSIDIDGQSNRLIDQALDERQVAFSDISGEDNPYVDFVVPLLTERGKATPPIGALLLRINLKTSLFPLFGPQSLPDSDANVVIVRSGDDDVEVLSRATSGLGDTLAGFSLPSALSPLPAAQLIREEDTVSGAEDDGDVFSNDQVLAVIRDIPGSSWYVMVTMDRQSIGVDARQGALRTLGITALLLLVVCLIVWLLRRHQVEVQLRGSNASLRREIAERHYYGAQLEKQAKQMEYQANHDSLTRLPNRNLLQDRLEQAICHFRRTGRCFAVLFLDLDHFKKINDSLGHPVGDALLKEVAERLRGSVRQDDTVARFGGDEFVIILEGLDSEHRAANIALQILQALTPAVKVEGYEFFITGSIGISLYPKDGAETGKLLKHADIAMYHAKEHGRNNIQFYAEDMNSRTLERLVMENNLRHALERDEFELHYQAQVDHLGRITGMEALLRWRHPVLGMVSPADFVPLAEETGVIVDIGRWVIQTACRQLKAWQQAGLAIRTVAVNLSPRQFMQANLPAFIASVLKEHSLNGSSLELEITEGLIMKDVERAIQMLHDLKAMQVQLSIDDFGTGYSSLSYLKRFPLDRLKIDKSFVNNITRDPDDAAITLAVIALAHSLRLKVIAEGVETEDQLSFLKSKHCDEMQGYYFSRPLPVAEATALMQQHGQTLH